MASTTSDTGDTSSKQQQAQCKEITTRVRVCVPRPIYTFVLQKKIMRPNAGMHKLHSSAISFLYNTSTVQKKKKFQKKFLKVLSGKWCGHFIFFFFEPENEN